MSKVLAVLLAFLGGWVLYMLAGGLGWVDWHQGALVEQAGPKSQVLGSQPKKKAKILVLNSFEDPAQCLLTMDGYGELARSGQRVSHGKHSLEALFLLRKDFYPDPTATPPSLIPADPMAATPTPTPRPEWTPRLLMGHGTAVALPKTDWSGFRQLRLDILNPDNRPINVQLEIADAKGFVFVLPASGLEGKKISTIGADLRDLADQDLDLSAIRHVALHVDIRGRGAAPKLFLDYLRLER